MSTSRRKQQRRCRDQEEAEAQAAAEPEHEVQHDSVQVGDQKFFITLIRNGAEWSCHGSLDRHSITASGATKTKAMYAWRIQGLHIIEQFGRIDERQAWIDSGKIPIEDRP